MTRVDQIASCAVIICTLDAGQKVGLYIGGLDGSDGSDLRRFDVEVRASNSGEHHVWDQVIIDGECVGNRPGGVHYLLVALGEREPRNTFCDRRAIAARDAFRAAQAALVADQAAAAL